MLEGQQELLLKTCVGQVTHPSDHLLVFKEKTSCKYTHESSTSSSKAEKMGSSRGLAMGSTVGPAELSWRDTGMGLADIL